jgi:hypothetical protein
MATLRGLSIMGPAASSCCCNDWPMVEQCCLRFVNVHSLLELAHSGLCQCHHHIHTHTSSSMDGACCVSVRVHACAYCRVLCYCCSAAVGASSCSIYCRGLSVRGPGCARVRIRKRGLFVFVLAGGLVIEAAAWKEGSLVLALPWVYSEWGLCRSHRVGFLRIDGPRVR